MKLMVIVLIILFVYLWQKREGSYHELEKKRTEDAVLHERENKREMAETERMAAERTFNQITSS